MEWIIPDQVHELMLCRRMRIKLDVRFRRIMTIHFPSKIGMETSRDERN